MYSAPEGLVNCGIYKLWNCGIEKQKPIPKPRTEGGKFFKM
jgi:hypothetical protein